MIFDHFDEIGSATTATDCTGNVVNEKLYYPFGEAWTRYALPNLGMHQEFAQLPDYDPETDQYNTANRHYSPMGRWVSPDPGGVKVVKPDDPQTWNLYAYVRNNPTVLTDPTGLYGVACASSVKQCVKAQKAFDKQLQKDLRSKDPAKRNAAATYGAFGDMGMTVTFASQEQVNADERAKPGNTVDAFTRIGIPSQDNRTPSPEPEFSFSLSGSDLNRAIVHEGTHIADMNVFLATYDSATGTFLGSANPVRANTEISAYSAGETVKPYSMFPAGPGGALQLIKWVLKNIENPNDTIFPNSMYPQRPDFDE